MDSEFSCTYCFQTNTIFVDPSGGNAQTYIEDCQVCCQPNQLWIHWHDDEDRYLVDSGPSQ